MLVQKMNKRNRFLTIVLLSIGIVLCVLFLASRFWPSSDTPYQIVETYRIDDFTKKLVKFETVFWEPRDTISLRKLIWRNPDFQGKDILEIGTGTGLLSLYCLNAGAKRVVATDVNPAAVANAAYNAQHLGVGDRFEVRQVPQDKKEAYSVIDPQERFDYIISNPPWENQRPESIDEYALYDEGFELLRSLIAGLRDHLKPNGKAYLAFGCVEAIRHAEELASQFNLRFRILDDRSLESLPEVFLPGMLLEITP